MPIDEYAAQSGLDKENYYAAAIDMLTVDGKLYGLPYTALPRPVLWYNDKFFAASGMAAPSADWTTDDWASAARSLRVDSDGDGNPEVFGTGYTMSDVEVEMILNGFGGGFLNREGTESLADTPESLAGAQFIYDLIYQDNSAPTGDQMEGNLHEMFGSGPNGHERRQLLESQILQSTDGTRRHLQDGAVAGRAEGQVPAVRGRLSEHPQEQPQSTGRIRVAQVLQLGRDQSRIRGDGFQHRHAAGGES